MNLEALTKVLSTEPKYRISQAKEWVFQKGITDWEQASNLPKELRERLKAEVSLEIRAKPIVSSDKKTTKVLITLTDGLAIEAVLMRHGKGRNTVCVSSQVGCAGGCAFCATGKMGFKRNLEPQEIVEQVLYFARILAKEEQRVGSVVFMGMGEPLLNYENVLHAIKILNTKDGLNIGARHISISTVGISDGIRALADFPLQVNLAISLHAPNNTLRNTLVPLNKTYPIGEVFSAIDEYIEKTNRRVMIEYLLIKHVNDEEEHAVELAKLIKSMDKPLVFVNVIKYNPNEIPGFVPSETKQIEKFKRALWHQKITVTERYRFGQEIKGACGQLATAELAKPKLVKRR